MFDDVQFYSLVAIFCVLIMSAWWNAIPYPTNANCCKYDPCNHEKRTMLAKAKDLGYLLRVLNTIHHFLNFASNPLLAYATFWLCFVALVSQVGFLTPFESYRNRYHGVENRRVQVGKYYFMCSTTWWLDYLAFKMLSGSAPSAFWSKEFSYSHKFCRLSRTKWKSNPTNLRQTFLSHS